MTRRSAMNRRNITATRLERGTKDLESKRQIGESENGNAEE
jgi:hypothetical protein